METPNRPCTYSFGDNGTTATVSPSGRLLRMSQHFPGLSYGYCVDHSSIPHPYAVVDRITPFLSSIDDPNHTIGFFPDRKWLGSGAQIASVGFKDERWPFFNISKDPETDGVQYFVSESVIHQTFTFRHGLPEIALMTDLLIRQLEFADINNTFNSADWKDGSYDTKLLHDAKCIKRWHKLNNEFDEHVALFISAYVGKTRVKFKKLNESYTVANSDEEKVQPVEITFVYALELIKAGSPPCMPKTLLFSDSPTTSQSFLNIAMNQERSFTVEPGLDKLLRRNLEHILSVCTVPVYLKANTEEEPAIAFTCGDVDDHRVATAASFYCFQILLLALKHFEDRRQDSETAKPRELTVYDSYMAKRIRKVLKGHLEWIFDAKFRGLARDPSCPHTWIDGKEIAGWKWNQYFAAASLVDAPFHLIKAGDFFEYDQGNTWNVPRSVGEAFKAWLEELDPKNKLGSYAFPRDMDKPTHSFYLTDHVLIWRAIKSAESLELKSYLCADITPKKAGNSDNGAQSTRKSEQRHYSSSKTQNQILKRFTAENPVSKKRMLSVSRSPGHIRFLLRTKDTSLFHAMDSGFFDKSGIDSAGDAWHNKIDIWKNLIDCQPLHDGNDDTAWDEPVRFALSIVLAQKGRRMNSLSPKEMCKRAITVLLDSAWHNGLFPGQLDLNGEPIIYEDELKRDQYWANTFEVPFTLWKFMQSSAKAQTTNPSQQSKSTPMTTEDPEFWIAFRDLMENRKSTRVLHHSRAEHMASNFPWNHVVDQTNIVQLSDEWLYNVPHFFGEPCSTFELGIFQDFYYRIFNNLKGKSNLKGVIIDVKRSKAGKKAPPKLESLSEFISEPDQLLDRIKNVRTPSEAKKRLFAFFSADPRLILLLPQSLQEFGHLLFFLRRHNEYDNYFYEHTEIEGNLWTTEFHLSFHVLDPEHPEDKEGKDDPDSAPTTGLMNDPPLTVDRNYVKLGKVAMGFRFDGDLFDRYWTCHFLDSNPQERWSEEKVNKQVKQILENSEPPERRVLNLSNEKKAPWRQRRVLELLLFQRVIDQMKDYTLKILEKVKSDVWKNTSEIEPQHMTSPFDEDEATFEGLDFDTFQKTSDRCQRYQRMLQKVDQDMTENFAKIELWLNREHERRTERPRWTFNDEIRYRSIISKLNVQNDHTLQDLRRSHTSISSYNESLTRRLESLRNDLEQRRADDIKRFTYVTVVFLPLGFATGIFSMSNAPAGHTLWKMVVTAFTALATTFILLLLSERLEEGAKLVMKTYPKWFLWPWNKIKKLGDKPAKETHKEAEQQNEGHAREEAGNRESGSQRRGNGASSMV